MKKISIGTTSVYIEAIAPSDRIARRQREREAVGRMASVIGVSIGHNPDGSPTADGVNISISHSARLAVAAIDPHRPVGVDVEECRDALWRVRPKFLTARELEAIDGAEDLLWAWTVKEAVYKASVAPRPQMTQIECFPTENMAQAGGCRYGLHSWLEGNTRITLAYPEHAD